jgi:hypothetical protein
VKSLHLDPAPDTNCPLGFFIALGVALWDSIFDSGRLPVVASVVRLFCAYKVTTVLLPPSNEQHSVANRGLVLECYHLAAAQELKNKDIPEGGAKAVVLVEPGKTQATLAVKAFSDGILDLTCQNEDLDDALASYLAAPEVKPLQSI